jgi:cytochrome c biogenesis factor
LLLSTTVAVPLLRWGGPPSLSQKKLLMLSLAAGASAAVVALVFGVRRPEAVIVSMLSGAAPVAFAAAVLLEVRRSAAPGLWARFTSVLLRNRRSFAGFTVHLGFVAVAIGVTGSSLGSQSFDAVMKEGDSLDWAGRRVRYSRLIQTELPDKLIAEAEIEVSEGNRVYLLRPARHFHILQEQWSSEVDIGSSWSGDFYTILNNGEGGTAVSLTFIEMPLVRWLWLGGAISGVGVVAAVWPRRRRSRARGHVSLQFAGTVAASDDQRPIVRKRAA